MTRYTGSSSTSLAWKSVDFRMSRIRASGVGRAGFFSICAVGRVGRLGSVGGVGSICAVGLVGRVVFAAAHVLLVTEDQRHLSEPGPQQSQRFVGFRLRRVRTAADSSPSSQAAAAATMVPSAAPNAAGRTRPWRSPTCRRVRPSAASSRPRISSARSASSSRPGIGQPDATAGPFHQLRAGLGLKPGDVVTAASTAGA